MQDGSSGSVQTFIEHTPRLGLGRGLSSQVVERTETLGECSTQGQHWVLGVPGRYLGSAGFKKASWRQQMLRQSLEWLVRVNLAKQLGRVFQAEGTAWAKHRGMPCHSSQYRWGPKQFRLRGAVERWE